MNRRDFYCNLGKKIKISVITVAYNSVATISDTLNTVAMQAYTDVEHLVIDGASEDGSLEIMKNHSNPQIRVFSEPDSGIYDAMNKGLAIASGEIVGFLNSDDFYSDAAVLSKIANAFQDPSVDACYADLVYVTQGSNRVVRYWKSKPFIKDSFAKGWCPAHPTFYVRSSVIERLGYYDQSYKLAADVDLMMRFLEVGRVRAVHIPHVLVRMRLGGASNQSWKNIVQQNKEIFAALRKNSIPFSRVYFLLNKVANRLWQLAVGRVNRYL